MAAAGSKAAHAALLALLALLALPGCGGGDPDGAHEVAAAPLASAGAGPSSSAEPVAMQARQATGGAWIGTLGERTTFGFVLEDGRYALLYSPPDQSAMLAGFVQGHGTVSSGHLASTDARDFPFGAAPASVSLSATLEVDALVGTVTREGGSTTTILMKHMAYYDPAPSLQSVAGTYAAQSSLGATGAFTISDAGALVGAGRPEECQLTGQLAPVAGNHVFDVTVTFTGPTCVYPGQVFTGLAFPHPAALQRLYLAVAGEGRAAGILFVGDKQP